MRRRAPARGEKFEWKLYDYDRPPDLAQRLVAAGIASRGEEWPMEAEVLAVPMAVALPPGVRLLPVTDEAGAGPHHTLPLGSRHAGVSRVTQPSSGVRSWLMWR